MDSVIFQERVNDRANVALSNFINDISKAIADVQKRHRVVLPHLCHMKVVIPESGSMRIEFDKRETVIELKKQTEKNILREFENQLKNFEWLLKERDLIVADNQYGPGKDQTDYPF